MRGTKRNHECANCGKSFQSYKDDSKFCSKPCFHQSRTKRTTAVCEVCGVEFLPVRGSKGRFCGQLCFARTQDRAESRPWSGEEIDVVWRTRNMTATEVASRLPGRSAAAVARLRVKITELDGTDFSGNDKDPFNVGKRRLLAKTCIGCGLLLDASWYSTFPQKNGTRTWKVRCTRCSRVNPTTGKPYDDSRERRAPSPSRSYKRLQAITRERASRHGFPWIDSDHVVLRNTTLTAFEKALKLGRTLASVRDAVTSNGYTSRVGKGDPMEGVWVIDNPNVEGLTA